MSTWDILLIAAIAAALILSLRAIFRRNKKGSGCNGCCQGCGGCARHYSAEGAEVTRSETPSK